MCYVLRATCHVLRATCYVLLGMMRALVRDAIHDLKHATRMLRRTRGFTAVAIGIVALGIAPTPRCSLSSTPCSSNRFPFLNRNGSSKLVTTSRSVRVAPLVSIPKFNVWRDEMRRLVDAIGAYQVSDPGVNLTGGDRPEHLRAMHVSAGYFDVFGAEIRLGRKFSRAQDWPNGSRVSGANTAHRPSFWRSSPSSRPIYRRDVQHE